MIAADTDYVQRVYKLNNVLGNYDGELSNPGELLRLEDAHGNLADEVEYSNHGNWPGWDQGWWQQHGTGQPVGGQPPAVGLARQR